MDNMSIKNANKIERDANYKLNSFTLFFKNENKRKASELYRRAGNLYKINGLIDKSINCYFES